MSAPNKTIPIPPNPYHLGIGLVALGFGLGIILILISGIGEVGRPKVGLMVSGIILATMAGIFFFGVSFAWRGFEKRFGPESLSGYWEIPESEWREHLETEKRKLLKAGLIAGVSLPLVLLVVFFVLAHFDHQGSGFIPIAFMVSGGLAAFMWISVMLRWDAFSGNQGCVWLAKRAVLMNQVAFFVDGFGMETLSRELIEEDGKFRLSIRYRVTAGQGTPPPITSWSFRWLKIRSVWLSKHWKIGEGFEEGPQICANFR